MKSRLIFPHCKNFFRNFLSHTPPPPSASASPHFRVPEALAVLSYFMLMKSIIRRNFYLLPRVAGAWKRWVRQKTGRTGNTLGIREVPLPSRVPLQDPVFSCPHITCKHQLLMTCIRNLRVQMSHSHPRTVLILVLKTAEFM